MPPRTSADVTSLIGANRKGSRLQLTVSGYVSLEQPAPAAFDDLVYVVVPSHNPEGSIALEWEAIHGGTMPAPGAAALVAYDENSTPYLLWWDGEYSLPLSPPTNIGSGDNLSYSGATTTGQVAEVQIGRASVPDTTLNPILKLARTINMQAAAVTGDGVEQASAGGGIITGTSSNQVQTVGWYGIAENTGTTLGVKDSPDACGVYGVGRALSGSVGVGMGAFFRGESASSSGKLSSVQIQAYNNRGSDDTESDSGFPNSSAIWMWADGPNQSSQAITIGNPFGQQFDAGIVLNGQVNGGKTGGVASTGIRLAGSYSKAAMSVLQGAGPVILGASTTGFANVGLDVVNSGAVDPIAVFRSSATSNVSIQVQNATGSSTYFAAGSTNAKLTGTVAGDTGIRVNTSSKFYHLGGTVSTIKVGQANTLGFFNATAVGQQTMGSATAGATYTSNEQTMLQAVYNAVRNVGLGT